MDKQKDILNTQLNAEETHKETYSAITEREQIQGTPFYAIRVEEKWFLVIGDHRVTSLLETKEDAIAQLEHKMWDIIAALILIITKTINEETKREQQPKTTL